MHFFYLKIFLIKFAFFYNNFDSRYTGYRFNRGDTTLKRNLDNRITGKVHQYHRKIYNTFGYSFNVLCSYYLSYQIS